MMPGLRSFSRVGVPSPVVETITALRSAKPVGSSVELRRQLQQQTQQTPPPQQPLPSSQRTDTDRPALPSPFQQQVITAPGLEVAIPEPASQRGSVAESRYSGGSSGSEHEPSSEYLAGLVSNFMEVEDRGAVSVEDDEHDAPAASSELASSIQALSACASSLESNLFADVLCAIRLSCPGPAPSLQDPDWSTQVNGATIRRAVMSRLRAAGYNAAVCKSRWDHSRGFPGGDYEYIDVVFQGGSSPVPQERLIVDLDFRAHFQVARPTPQFEAALMFAPVVFVGRADRLQQLVEALSDACRKSLRVQGMHLPPWRKVEYLRAKWLAPYKRTTNPMAQTTAAAQQHQPHKAKATPPAVPRVVAPFQTQSTFGFNDTVATQNADNNPALTTAPRKCAPRAAPRGVLGMLLQEHIGRKPSPVL